MRLSVKGLRVLASILWHGEACGAALSKATGVGPGTLYPLLARAKREGWLTSRWEEIDPVAEGRPRRQFYDLTERGRERVRAEIIALRAA